MPPVGFFLFFIVFSFSCVFPDVKWDEIPDLCTSMLPMSVVRIPDTVGFSRRRHRKSGLFLRDDDNLNLLNELLRLRILHQRKPEPFLPEVLD